MHKLSLLALFGSVPIMSALGVGHLAMVIGVAAMIIVHEFGHWIVARLCGVAVPTFSVGFDITGHKIVFAKIWGTDFQVTPWLFGGYVSINPGDESFDKLRIWQRAAILLAGVTANVISAFVVMAMLFGISGKRDIQVDTAHPAAIVIGLASPYHPAASAGIKENDEIVSVNDEKVTTPEAVIQAVQKGKDAPIEIVVLREGKEQKFGMTATDKGQVGLMLAPKAEFVFVKMSPAQAVYEAGKQTVMFFPVAIKQLLIKMHILPGESQAQFISIVGIVQIGATFWQSGFYVFMQVLAMISLNLALANLLPIPILDGGHLLFLSIEAVRGKPVSKKVQIFLCNVFLRILVLLAAFLILRDIFYPAQLPGAQPPPPQTSAPAAQPKSP